MYDLIASYIKYNEGFMYKESTQQCVTRPKAFYTDLDKQLLYAADALWSIACVSKTSALFLLMAAWNHLAQTTSNINFLSSREIQVYILYAPISIIIYFVLMGAFSSDHVLMTIAPQLMYHVELFVLCGLVQFSAYRLRKVMARMEKSSRGYQRLNYCTRLTPWLTFFIFTDALGLAIINVDTLGSRAVYNNKFWTDFWSRVFNFGYSFTYPVIILMLYGGTEEGHAEYGQSSAAFHKQGHSVTSIPGPLPKLVQVPATVKVTSSIRESVENNV